MGPTCQVDDCGNPTPDLVCNRHLDQLRGDLRDIEAVITELDVTLARQAKTGGSGGKKDKGEAQPLAFHAGVSEVIADLRNTLVTWVRTIHNGNDTWPDDTLPAMAAWLAFRTDWARTDAEGPQMCDEIEFARKQAWRAVDRRALRVFAGPCLAEQDDGSLCQLDLYARPDVDATIITCDGYGTDLEGCGHEHTIQRRREFLRVEMEAALAPWDDIVDSLPVVLGGALPDRQVLRQWRHRGSRGGVPVRGTLHGVAQYRGGDVIERVLAWRADGRVRRGGRCA